MAKAIAIILYNIKFNNARANDMGQRKTEKKTKLKTHHTNKSRSFGSNRENVFSKRRRNGQIAISCHCLLCCRREWENRMRYIKTFSFILVMYLNGSNWTTGQRTIILFFFFYWSSTNTQSSEQKANDRVLKKTGVIAVIVLLLFVYSMVWGGG